MSQDVRHESGTSAILRQRFSRTGTLQNANDNKFRGIMNEEPVFAFSKSFYLNSSSTTSGTNDSVTFTIAHIQDPVVQFASARGLTFMKPLWQSFFSSVQNLLAFHYMDFRNARTLASNYSTQLAIDAYKSGADDYVDIVALGARQVLGATSFSGTPDNPILFLKEISSNGNFQTIDVIFPSFPFFLYTNPRWLAYLLEPLIEHMLSGQYPNDYAMHDLGAHFPNATGHPLGRDEYMPVEECGNILIMGLAIVNSLRYTANETVASIWSTLGKRSFDETTADGSLFALNALEERDGMAYLDDSWGGEIKGEKQARKWVERSYKLWRQWTRYLVDFSLIPANQCKLFYFASLPLTNNILQCQPTISQVGLPSRPTSLSKGLLASMPCLSSPLSPAITKTPSTIKTSLTRTSRNGKNTACLGTELTRNCLTTGMVLGRPSTTSMPTLYSASTLTAMTPLRTYSLRVTRNLSRSPPSPNLALYLSISIPHNLDGITSFAKRTASLWTAATSTPKMIGNSLQWL